MFKRLRVINFKENVSPKVGWAEERVVNVSLVREITLHQFDTGVFLRVRFIDGVTLWCIDSLEEIAGRLDDPRPRRS